HNPPIVDFLFDVNKKFNEIKSSSSGEPIDIAIKQSEALENLLKYISNPDLKSPNQEEYRRLCFMEWRLPIEE
ncbi:4159_t:CDS:2, partial [Scutellospora calospora]